MTDLTFHELQLWAGLQSLKLDWTACLLKLVMLLVLVSAHVTPALVNCEYKLWSLETL